MELPETTQKATGKGREQVQHTPVPHPIESEWSVILQEYWKLLSSFGYNYHYT